MDTGNRILLGAKTTRIEFKFENKKRHRLPSKLSNWTISDILRKYKAHCTTFWVSELPLGLFEEGKITQPLLFSV